MAKFCGRIGFGHQVETGPGVWSDTIVEYVYSGDVVRNSYQLREAEKVNDDLSVGNSISIVADAYANDNFFAMRYVEFAGTLWKVADVTVERPRLLLRLGEVYNGPQAAASGTP